MGERVTKATVPIAIQPGTKLIQLRYETETHTWELWLHHNLTMQHGTYLRLEVDGGIERVTVRPDGTEETFRVRM
jgi:hypothetical protein